MLEQALLAEIDRANTLIERLTEQVCDGDLTQALRQQAEQLHTWATDARESLRTTLIKRPVE